MLPRCAEWQLYLFRRVLQNCGKQLSTYCLLTRPSFLPHGTTRLTLDGFSWNLIWECFVKNLSRKFKFHQNASRVTGTSHEDVRTFVVLSRLFLLKMRNVSDESCRENQNTHFMFNSIFPKIVPFTKYCGKVLYSRAGHRWQYGALHAGYLRLQTHCFSNARMHKRAPLLRDTYIVSLNSTQ